MLKNPDFYLMLQELVDFGIARYQENYSRRYQDTDLVLYKKYTYEMRVVFLVGSTMKCL